MVKENVINMRNCHICQTNISLKILSSLLWVKICDASTNQQTLKIKSPEY
jgi:hypothetical protein